MQTLPVCHEHSTIIEFVQCRACFELKEREGNNNNTNNKQKKNQKNRLFLFFPLSFKLCVHAAIAYSLVCSEYAYCHFIVVIIMIGET